jgi:hypothetical protein
MPAARRSRLNNDILQVRITIILCILYARSTILYYIVKKYSQFFFTIFITVVSTALCTRRGIIILLLLTLYTNTIALCFYVPDTRNHYIIVAYPQYNNISLHYIGNGLIARTYTNTRPNDLNFKTSRGQRVFYFPPRQNSRIVSFCCTPA